MRDLYMFLTGPGLIVALLVFFGGLAARALLYVQGLDWKLDRVAYIPHFKQGLKGAAQSIYRWLIPFGTHGWRKSPFFTVGFFAFHFGVIVLPLLVAGHAVIAENLLGFWLPHLPPAAADFSTLCAIGAAGLILARRIALPEVRHLSTWRDYAVLGLATLPLLSGFLAARHFPGYDYWLLLHMVSAEALLILAPFTKLSHIALFFMSRAQLGMDYSIKRGGDYRGTSFPW